MLVDDAVVVVESVYYRMQRGVDGLEAAVAEPGGHHVLRRLLPQFRGKDNAGLPEALDAVEVPAAQAFAYVVFRLEIRTDLADKFGLFRGPRGHATDTVVGLLPRADGVGHIALAFQCAALQLQGFRIAGVFLQHLCKCAQRFIVFLLADVLPRIAQGAVL